MEAEQILKSHLNLLHTTKMGAIRIQKNLRLTPKEDVVTYCKNKILDKKSLIYQQGKNWYCKIDQVIVTIHASSYTIITAHIVK
ncbi:MAG: DUF3781 domain-containing protein [Bacilli bacterium]|jgi:hypothetical protein|nr:DUF3781 domain-containing protein [Bacilli bacterium]